MEHNIALSKIPTIDLKSSDKEKNSKLFHDTCKEIGFFYLTGHSIPPAFLNEVLHQSKTLFSLPLNEKQKLTDRILNRGYTSFEEETLDPTTQGIKGDTKEGYYILKDISKDDPRYNPSKLRGPNVWPDTDTTATSMKDAQNFQDVMNKYMQEMSIVAMELVQLIASSLNLDRRYFDSYFNDSSMTCLRLLHYSKERSNINNGIFGCGAHSDYGMITLLLTDDNPGLEIYARETNEWICVPPKSGAFIVNLGDMLERWTNGVYRSTLHRVVIRDNGKEEGDGEERYSIPFFFDPHFDTVVECVEGCYSEDNPKRYEKITAGEHLLGKYRETYADFTPVG